MSTGGLLLWCGFLGAVRLFKEVSFSKMPLEPTTAGVPNHCSPLDADISTVEGVSQGDSASLLWGKPILGQT
jgi:hypothetical protein